MRATLVCGGTGALGSLIVERLAQRGIPFRALLRPTADDAAIRSAGGEVVRGDLRDPDSLRPAVEGVGTIVSSANSLGRALAGERTLTISGVDDDGYASLIAAAEAAGVERLVFLSTALDPLAVRLAPYAAAKAATEERLRRSSIRPVLIRPDMFQEIWCSPATQFDWPNGKLTIFGRGDTKGRYVATADVAELVVRLTVADDPPEVVEFGGPEAFTRNELADLFERETGRRMRRRHVPRAALRAGAALLRRPKPALASVMGMGLAADLADATWTDAPLREAGIEPRSTTAYVRSLVGAATARD
jgi:NADH dehydrogenase